MNQWNKVWAKRTSDIEMSNDIFEMFCQLKKADGFDTQEICGYYEAFFQEWHRLVKRIEQSAGKITSVYEVGCGSGVNLYLFQQIQKLDAVGGCDYSKLLVQLACKVVRTDDLQCMEAECISEVPKYDMVLADSVFQYFQNTEYGMNVLKKMWNKARKVVAITEIHDEEMKEEHLNFRRRCVENYDEKYEGLDKTFYTKDMFQKFAEHVGAQCLIAKPENELYWNNKYVFDCYLIKA